MWLPPARARLRRVTQWLGRIAPIFAAKWVQRVADATANISALPEIGEPLVDEAFAGQILREIVVKPYRLVYRCDGSECYVVAIIDTSKQFARELMIEDLF